MVAPRGKRLTVAEAACQIGVSEKTTRRLINRGELPAYRPTPRKVLVFAADLDAYIEGHRTGLYGASEGGLEGESM